MQDKKVETMDQRVREYIRRYGMLDEGDRVIAGVSGGADSICLLFMLVKLREEMGFTVLAVHVHHGLRGEAADADAAYVKKVCEEWGVELRTFRKDVRKIARERGLTIEEAARDVRREIFRKVQEEAGGTKIALAHHQNDNAETLIWNLCRGCGIRGLGGIAPVTGPWIRPLLCLDRGEIESYLKNLGISYCTDASNLEDDYTRNRIRKYVIPYLKEHVNRQTVLHMSETMEQMRMLGEHIMQETKEYARACIHYEDYGGAALAVLDKERFLKVPEALRSFVLHEMLCRVAGRRKDIEAEHTRMLMELLEKQVGRRIHLPYGMCARRCYEGIELSVLSAKTRRPDESLSKEPAAFRVFDRSGGEVIFPQNPYTKWFDYDIIKNTVKIRHREPGDYITISKSGGTQKIKQYFINEKIPKELRDGIWLAADGKHIMWIVGYRQNQKYQVTDKTRKILEIAFYGGEDNGGEYKSDDSQGRSCEED